ncbi:MAG TPA: LapA family protein [Gaiellaceae bacterium]|nr:LapA family protein [Gaiellaceae bacterium]
MKLLRRKGLDSETRETFQPRLWLVVGGLALLMAYVVAFIAQNNKSVTVHFVLTSAKTSVIWLILLSLAIGLIGGVLLSQLERRRGRKQRD